MSYLTIDEKHLKKLIARISQNGRRRNHLEAIQDFMNDCDISPSFWEFERDQMKIQIDGKSERFKKFKKETDYKPDVESWERPGWIASHKPMANCECCGSNLGGRPGFIMKQNGKWRAWCVLTNCARNYPPEFAIGMLANKNYQQWLNGGLFLVVGEKK